MRRQWSGSRKNSCLPRRMHCRSYRRLWRFRCRSDYRRYRWNIGGTSRPQPVSSRKHRSSQYWSFYMAFLLSESLQIRFARSHTRCQLRQLLWPIHYLPAIHPGKSNKSASDRSPIRGCGHNSPAQNQPAFPPPQNGRPPTYERRGFPDKPPVYADADRRQRRRE